MSRKQMSGRVQLIVVLLFAAAVMGMAWVAQYVLIQASARPRAAGAPAPK